MGGEAPSHRPGAHPPTPSRKREGEPERATESPPLPLAGGDRGVGTRHRLGRPTELARKLRSDATDVERKLWRHIRHSQLEGFKFSRQIPIAGYVCDLVCRSERLVVELDGGQRGEQIEADLARTKRIEAAGYRVIRFWNNEVNENLEGVLTEILRALRAGAHPPTPSRKREGEPDSASGDLPLPLAGGDRGVGTRHRLGRPTQEDGN